MDSSLAGCGWRPEEPEGRGPGELGTLEFLLDLIYATNIPRKAIHRSCAFRVIRNYLGCGGIVKAGDGEEDRGERAKAVLIRAAFHRYHYSDTWKAPRLFEYVHGRTANGDTDDMAPSVHPDLTPCPTVSSSWIGRGALAGHDVIRPVPVSGANPAVPASTGRGSVDTRVGPAGFPWRSVQFLGGAQWGRADRHCLS